MNSKYSGEPGYPDGPRFSPDGWTEQAIDALLTDLDVAAMTKPRPTSALMNGTGAQRQSRRRTRRHAAAVVRALPTVCGAAGGSGGWAA
ncbi:MAG: hypothetical protein ACRDS0_22880 [Pseudonocardiaceae bacterium]